jgi:hypothetical protein
MRTDALRSGLLALSTILAFLTIPGRSGAG